VFNLDARAYLVLFWVGLMALIRGITTIVLAFMIRHAGRAVAAG
jgi:hypothetical protein